MWTEIFCKMVLRASVAEKNQSIIHNNNISEHRPGLDRSDSQGWYGHVKIRDDRRQERGNMKCMTEVYGNSAVATPDGKSRKKKKRKQT